MSQDVFFANGTTALAAALAAVGCHDRLVAVPAAVCPSVPAAVLASGNRPYLVDIESGTLGLCPDRLDAIGDKIGAVIAVHAYGNPCRMDDIATVARRHGVPVIEDCAQAEGAEQGGVPVGTIGDVAVFSYGAGKILDIGGGGRAVAGDAALGQALADYAHALTCDGDEQAADDLSYLYKVFYNRFFPDRMESYQFILPRVLADAGTRQLGRAKGGLEGRVAHARRGLAVEVRARRAKAQRYRARLEGRTDVELLPQPANAAPWRFNMLLPVARRDDVLKTFLREGRPVSSWYPDLGLFVGDAFPRTPTPVAGRVGAGIFNLWLDGATDDDAIDDACDALCRLLDAL